MTIASRATSLIAATGIASLVLSGCATSADSSKFAAGAAVNVVAVSDTYGSIVESIGGDRVEVISLAQGTSQDPHEYEAKAQDQLAVSEADLVIMNGGGYDDFMQKLVERSDAVVINASESSGLMPASTESAEHANEDEEGAAEHQHIEGFNEHVWYSLHGVEHIAEAIEATLIELDPEGASEYEQNGAQFLAGLEALHTRVQALAESIGGADIVETEPVASYLLTDLGFHNVTPAEFSEAVEEGSGVGVAILAEVLDLLQSGEIVLLAENTQAGGAEALQVSDAAQQSGIPVVQFTENVPAGDNYLDWMSTNIDAVQNALT